MPATRTPEQIRQVCASLRAGHDLAGTREWALDLLADIGRGRQTLPAVDHPLGFVCIPLHRHGRCGLCFHVWPEPAGQVSGRTVVHAHSWRMTSLILLGQVTNENIEIVDHIDPTHRVLRVLSWRGVDRIVPTGRLVRPVTALRQSLAENARYSLDAGIFHRTVCGRGSRAATLVLGDHRPGARDFLLGDLGKRRYAMVRRRCDWAQVRATVGAALAGSS